MYSYARSGMHREEMQFMQAVLTAEKIYVESQWLGGRVCRTYYYMYMYIVIHACHMHVTCMSHARCTSIQQPARFTRTSASMTKTYCWGLVTSSLNSPPVSPERKRVGHLVDLSLKLSCLQALRLFLGGKGRGGKLRSLSLLPATVVCGSLPQ